MKSNREVPMPPEFARDEEIGTSRACWYSSSLVWLFSCSGAVSFCISYHTKGGMRTSSCGLLGTAPSRLSRLGTFARDTCFSGIVNCLLDQQDCGSSWNKLHHYGALICSWFSREWLSILHLITMESLSFSCVCCGMDCIVKNNFIVQLFNLDKW